MIDWWKNNWKWVTPILTAVWTIFVFGIGHYVSFKETEAKLEVATEKIVLLTKIVESFDNRFTKLEDYLLYKDRQ